MSGPSSSARTAEHLLARLAEDAELGTEEPVARARLAGLRYVSDESPGLRRRRCGRGFTYLDGEGRTVRDAATRRRIGELAIPPAWTEVWICPTAKGHLQATGRDEKGRKQYRYHDLWRAVSDARKYARLVPFAAALPGLRRRVRRDLGRDGLDRRRVLASLVRLLERTHLRIGNEESARDNESYGLTTLGREHIEVDGDDLLLEFDGKGGKPHVVSVREPRIAQIVRECQEIPGCELFRWTDAEGVDHPVDSGDLNDYLREAMGGDFTAKDFRTWAGTVAAVEVLAAMEPPQSEGEATKDLVEAVKQVAETLGNTPAVTREFYIHPAVFAAHQKGTLQETCALAAVRAAKGGDREMRRSELATLAILDPEEAAQRKAPPPAGPKVA